jgi:hypothetical protein
MAILVIHQPAPCCQCVVMVCCLFFNFAELFDFWVLLTGSGDDFSVCYLPYFRQWLTIRLLLAFLPFEPLFTDISCGDQLLSPPRFSGALSAFPPPLLCGSFQFMVYYSVYLVFMCVCGVSLPRGLC